MNKHLRISITTRIFLDSKHRLAVKTGRAGKMRSGEKSDIMKFQKSMKKAPAISSMHHSGFVITLSSMGIADKKHRQQSCTNE